MPTFEITSPDGKKFRVTAPDGATQEQVLAYAQSQFKPKEPPKPIDPTEGMGAFARGAAGAGKFLNDLRLGLGQRLGMVDQKTVDEARALDAPLMNTTAGRVGNFVGAVGFTAPAMMIPGVNSVSGAAATGAALGAAQPTSGDESALENAALGGVFGAGGQMLGNAVGKGINSLSQPFGQVNPANVAAAETLKKYGIATRPDQATGSRVLQNANAAMDNLPFTAGPQQAFRQAQQGQLNKAVAKLIGQDADAITPEVLSAARSGIGAKFTDLSARNTLNAGDDFVNQLAALQSRVVNEIPTTSQNVINSRINNVFDKIKDGAIEGGVYRKLDSNIGKAMKTASDGDTRAMLGELRDLLRGQMDSSISKADQAAWQEARRQYANLMTIADTVKHNPAGDVSARNLLNVMNNASRETKFGGGGDLAELARAAKIALPDAVPNSGTAQRALWQSLMQANLLGLVSALPAAAARPVINSEAAKRAAIYGLMNEIPMAPQALGGGLGLLGATSPAYLGQ